MSSPTTERIKSLSRELDRSWYARYGRLTVLILLELLAYGLSLVLLILDGWLIAKGRYLYLHTEPIAPGTVIKLALENEALNGVLLLLYLLLFLSAIGFVLLARVLRASRLRMGRMHELRLLLDEVFP